MTPPDLATAALSSAASHAQAVATRSLHLVAELLAILRKHPSYTTTEQQETMRAARALLIEQGVEVERVQAWEDR